MVIEHVEFCKYCFISPNAMALTPNCICGKHVLCLLCIHRCGQRRSEVRFSYSTTPQGELIKCHAQGHSSNVDTCRHEGLNPGHGVRDGPANN